MVEKIARLPQGSQEPGRSPPAALQPSPQLSLRIAHANARRRTHARTHTGGTAYKRHTSGCNETAIPHKLARQPFPDGSVTAGNRRAGADVDDVVLSQRRRYMTRFQPICSCWPSIGRTRPIGTDRAAHRFLLCDLPSFIQDHRA